MSGPFPMNRRHFLTLTVTASGAMLLRFPLSAGAAPAAAAQFMTGFLEISPDNQLFLLLNRHEMGQGMADGLRTLLAEELNTAPDLIGIRLLSSGPGQANPNARPASTGGSFSMRGSWEPVRQAGAYCRELLLKAGMLALEATGAVPLEPEMSLRDGRVLAPGVEMPFASLAPMMNQARERVDSEQATPLPPPWRFIGQSSRRSRLREKVTGTLQYGYDRPCALVASIERNRPHGAEPAGYDAKAALAVPGVKAVLKLHQGIAVVATNTWAALRGRKALQVRWQGGVDVSHAGIDEALSSLLDRDDLRHTVMRQGGPFTTPVALERQYCLPMLAHAPMEPLSCTVSVTAERCVVQVGTQQPAAIRDLAARITGLPQAQVQLDDELSGGSFGRRLSKDFIIEALELGTQLKQPVKVLWTREDQFDAGFFRPPAAIRIRGYGSDNGALTGLQHQVASPARLWDELPAQLASGWKGQAKHYLREMKALFSSPVEYGNGITGSTVVGDSAVDGVRQPAYHVLQYQLEHVPVELPLPMGFWRSVGNSLNIFALESFIDEWAQQHRLDPLQLRIDLTPDHHRLHRVLRRVAKQAGWQDRSRQRPLGLAAFSGYDSHVATIVALRPDAGGPDRIANIYCTVDCGTLINPDIVRAQVEGALTMGLSAALLEQVQLEQGRVQSRNFDGYPILTLAQAPPLQIELVASAEAPGGIGETALPTIAPALVNAWRLLSGENIASLPFSAVRKGRS